MLYVVTERWRPAEKYCKAFEWLKELVHSHDRTQNLPATADNIVADSEARSTFDNLQQDFGIDIFSQMITNVTSGGPPHQRDWDGIDFSAGGEVDFQAFDDTETYDFDPIISDLSFLDGDGNYGGLFNL